VSRACGGDGSLEMGIVFGYIVTWSYSIMDFLILFIIIIYLFMYFTQLCSCKHLIVWRGLQDLMAELTFELDW
jgi:hypothetical protein